MKTLGELPFEVNKETQYVVRNQWVVGGKTYYCVYFNTNEILQEFLDMFEENVDYFLSKTSEVSYVYSGAVLINEQTHTILLLKWGNICQ